MLCWSAISENSFLLNVCMLASGDEAGRDGKAETSEVSLCEANMETVCRRPVMRAPISAPVSIRRPLCHRAVLQPGALFILAMCPRRGWALADSTEPAPASRKLFGRTSIASYPTPRRVLFPGGGMSCIGPSRRSRRGRPWRTADLRDTKCKSIPFGGEYSCNTQSLLEGSSIMACCPLSSRAARRHRR